MVFGIGEDAPYHSLQGFFGGRFSGVECHYFVICANISLDNVFPLITVNVAVNSCLYKYCLYGLRHYLGPFSRRCPTAATTHRVYTLSQFLMGVILTLSNYH